jgi:hypothetical protein
MQNLKSGLLRGILDAVIADPDLDLQIRDNYLNIYYKGNSLLKLSERDGDLYIPEIHEKFIQGLEIENLVDEQTTDKFLMQIPEIKENIIQHGKSSLEIEYEQLIIRANNDENRNNSDYFIIDRQYTTIERERFDLTGIFWDWKGRRKGQTVPLCLMEIKFALNTEIRNLDEQIGRYYKAIEKDFRGFVRENQNIFMQKIDLGLFNQPEDRVEAMKTLTISEDIMQAQFIIILVDYNPYSKLFELDRLKELSFQDQIKIFHSGFAMWEPNLKKI